jgi:hypothetical protein
MTDRIVIPKLGGKTVKIALYDLADNGDPFVRIEFTDGTTLDVCERGQAGWIAYEVVEPPYEDPI